MSDPAPITPTQEIYPELQKAFDFFNTELFEGKLPACLLTLQREKTSQGYFSYGRFINHDGERTDEIALNPCYFAVNSLEYTMSIVVHEQVHLYQRHFGTPGRSRYHNKEWGDLMEELGLMPSHTFKPGGKRTGDKVGHYIIEGGKFQEVCTKLLSQDFRLSWMDRFPAAPGLRVLYRDADIESDDEPGAVMDDDTGVTHDDGGGEEGQRPSDGPARGKLKKLRDMGVVVDLPKGQKNKSNRSKYGCPGCNVQLWGKPNLNIICGNCDLKFDERL